MTDVADPDAGLQCQSTPLVPLIAAEQAPLLARPFYAGGDPGPIMAALAHVPELLEVAAPFLGAVFGPSCLPTRTKEIVILRTSARASCRYCIQAHSVVAVDAGLTKAEVRALRGELDTTGTFREPAELAVIGWCDELVGTGAVAPEVTARLRDRFADHEVIELTLLAATTLLSTASAPRSTCRPHPRSWPASPTRTFGEHRRPRHRPRNHR